MTSTIKISEKDKVFQIATNNGWVAKMGTQVTIDGWYRLCNLSRRDINPSILAR